MPECRNVTLVVTIAKREITPCHDLLANYDALSPEFRVCGKLVKAEKS